MYGINQYDIIKLKLLSLPLKFVVRKGQLTYYLKLRGIILAINMIYIQLAVAVIAEVIATSALKAAEGFTKPIPSIIVVIGYAVAFYFLSLTLRTLPVGVTYAIWSGLGVVFITIVGMLMYKQIPDLPAILGMVLITSGVIVIQLFSKTVSH